MYLNPVRSYYQGSEQCASAGPFLLLLQVRDKPLGPENTFAVVRKVALRQLGHWMMGKVRLHGKGPWATVSGSYGSDGLPMTVDALPKDAKPLPRDLYDAWNKGGGWNGAGNEATAMRQWAKQAFQI
jgi:hypothetical protein